MLLSLVVSYRVQEMATAAYLRRFAFTRHISGAISNGSKNFQHCHSFKTSNSTFNFPINNPLRNSCRLLHSKPPRLGLPTSAGNGLKGGAKGGFVGRGGAYSNFCNTSSSSSWLGFGVLGFFTNGWRSRVAADSQFPFKVIMEQLVGVSACVLGDMATRPNFGLNELDFVFSTLVVTSILNFTLMYLLAPTANASTTTLPAMFANCPTSHMFEPGAYTLLNRFGTVAYKGLIFAAVGFGAGLVGTALSNGLVKMRKKMDPSFETPNKPPPTLLNALTWAIQVGVSSNLRYQTLNGIEFLLAKGLPPLVFKTSVVALRCFNNVLGGVSFVLLARLTGSQSVGDPKMAVAEEA